MINTSRLWPQAFRSRSSSRGSSLIEVLVSIVIASIGLLALAGINAASLKYSKLSQYRATATMLTNDISERMRSNYAGTATIANYAFTSSYSGQSTISVPTLCNSAASNCNTATMATFDLYEWRQSVRDSLPDGRVFLKPDASASGSADLWIVWSDATLAAEDEVVRAGGSASRECHADLGLTSDQRDVRCLYFRVRL